MVSSDNQNFSPRQGSHCQGSERSSLPTALSINMFFLPSSSSLSSRLASLLSFLSCRSISALIRFCSCCSSERQHAITAAAIHTGEVDHRLILSPIVIVQSSTVPGEAKKPRSLGWLSVPRHPRPSHRVGPNGSLKDYGFEAIQAASAINELVEEWRRIAEQDGRGAAPSLRRGRLGGAQAQQASEYIDCVRSRPDCGTQHPGTKETPS